VPTIDRESPASVTRPMAANFGRPLTKMTLEGLTSR